MEEGEGHTLEGAENEALDLNETGELEEKSDDKKEEETTAVATIITREHQKITHHLIDRVMEILEGSGNKITSYTVEDESWLERETLKLSIGEKTTLTLLLARTK